MAAIPARISDAAAAEECAGLAWRFCGLTEGLPAAGALVGPFSSAFFGWLSGINSAVVMSLYTRRLASRFMDCPIWVIVLLYAYAALQPGFGVLGKDNIEGTLLLLNFALVLKTLLFLYMIWVFRYGWLLCYFVQVAQFRGSAMSRMKLFSRLLE